MTAQFVPHHTRAGLSELSEEYHEVEAETDALARFSKELAKLDTSSSEKNFLCGNHSATTFGATTTDTGTSTRTVRDLYQNTIMDVAHYEEQYGESFTRNCTVEFGPEIATALQGDKGLVPPLKNQLLQVSQEAYRERMRLLRKIKHERASLENIDEQLTELGSNCEEFLIVRSFSEWSNERLLNAQRKAKAHEQECQRLTEKRQTDIQEYRSVKDRQDDDAFTNYLYGSLLVTYPALADICDFVQTLQNKQSRISTLLSEGANR